MAALDRFGDTAVILSLVLAVSVWLYWRGERRQISYWIAAGAFAIFAGPLLEILLRIPGPDMGISEVSRWSFPSSHTLQATVVYGFLAVVLAGSM
jgi:undecaprenyl-diphosphatase